MVDGEGLTWLRATVGAKPIMPSNESSPVGRCERADYPASSPVALFSRSDLVCNGVPSLPFADSGLRLFWIGVVVVFHPAPLGAEPGLIVVRGETPRTPLTGVLDNRRGIPNGDVLRFPLRGAAVATTSRESVSAVALRDKLGSLLPGLARGADLRGRYRLRGLLRLRLRGRGDAGLSTGFADRVDPDSPRGVLSRLAPVLRERLAPVAGPTAFVRSSARHR